MYKKLAGMTGTAETEAAEFTRSTNCEVVVILTNRKMIRAKTDMVYRTEVEKFRTPPRNQEYHAKGQAGAGRHHLGGEVGAPLRHLKKMGVRHEVLNRQEPRARSIDRGAGRSQRNGTVSTNMAGAVRYSSRRQRRGS